MISTQYYTLPEHSYRQSPNHRRQIAEIAAEMEAGAAAVETMYAVRQNADGTILSDFLMGNVTVRVRRAAELKLLPAGILPYRLSDDATAEGV